MENFQITPEILRQGSHSQTFKGINKSTGEAVAIKKFEADENPDDGPPPALLREVLLLQRIPKPISVVNRLIVARQFDDHDDNTKPSYYIVYEHLSSDLRTFMDSHAVKPMPPDLVKKLLFQILRGVEECHCHAVVHRDLNPGNLMVDDKAQSLKIGDAIGQSYSFLQEVSEIGNVALNYQAPEALLGSNGCSTPVDIWAVGCIFAEMVTGDVLFVGIGDDPRNADKEHLREIFRQLGKPTEFQWTGVTALPGWNSYQDWEGDKKKARFYSSGDLPSDMLLGSVSLEQAGADLLSKMLMYDPVARITAKAAMEHPYFEQMII